MITHHHHNIVIIIKYFVVAKDGEHAKTLVLRKWPQKCRRIHIYKLFLKLIIIVFSQSRSALQLAHTELFRAQIEYSVGDMDTMMALSFGQMVSGHVQGPYGEPNFVPIMGYRSVGDERSLNL